MEKQNDRKATENEMIKLRKENRRRLSSHKSRVVNVFSSKYYKISASLIIL